ncbi:MAG: hypothetical protein GY833_06750 [Aestuariibacter sp.]|nr:hypothetical protein [Aestuariibacter sp.]
MEHKTFSRLADDYYDDTNNQTATTVFHSVHSSSGFIFEPLVPADTKHPQAHPLYWADMKRAHGLIAELRRLQCIAHAAPNAYGCYKYGVFLPKDLLAAEDVANDFLYRCLMNPAVRRILKAHGRLKTIQHQYWL